jgi:hypothetical protein
MHRKAVYADEKGGSEFIRALFERWKGHQIGRVLEQSSAKRPSLAGRLTERGKDDRGDSRLHGMGER